MGELKPSKAIALAGTVDYIKKIEKERVMLRGLSRPVGAGL